MEPSPIAPPPMSPQPVTPPAAPIPSRSKPKHLLKIALIITVFLSLGTAGFFGYQYMRLKRQAAKLIPTIAPFSTPDVTANWKTYTDPLNKFSLKYPSDWTSSKNTNNKNTYTQVVDLVKTLDSAFYSSDQTHVIWVKDIDNPSNKSLKEIVQSGMLDNNYGSLSATYKITAPIFSVTTTNGYQVYQPDANWPSAFGIKTVFIHNPLNQSYAWLSLEPYDNQNLNNIFNQILSTFKFLNNETTPGAGSGSGSACQYKGKTYTDGEGFKDSCNSCSCDNGQVMCTLMACQ